MNEDTETSVFIVNFCLSLHKQLSQIKEVFEAEKMKMLDKFPELGLLETSSSTRTRFEKVKHTLDVSVNDERKMLSSNGSGTRNSRGLLNR